MSVNFSAFSDEAPSPAATGTPTTFRARVLRSLASPGERCLVALRDDVDLALPAADWPPRADGSLPARDDECYVTFDDAGNPLIIGWHNLAATSAPEAWQDLAPHLLPGWTAFNDDAAFYKDRDRVYLRGDLLFNASAPGANNKQIADLPVGYRPDYQPELPMFANIDSTVAATLYTHWSAYVTSDGRIALHNRPDFISAPNYGGAPDETVFSTDSISFRVA